MDAKELEKLIHNKRISLDTSIFIYALEGNNNFPLSQELFRLIPKSKATVYASVIVITEMMNKIYEVGAQNRVTDYLNFIHGNGLISIVNVDRPIALKSAQMRAKYGLKPPDAIHLATAIENNCEYFITTDNDFSNDTEELKIVYLPDINKNEGP